MNFTTTFSEARVPFSKNILLKSYVLVFVMVWVTTFINTTDRANWWIENMLTITCLSILFITYAKFQFSDMAYAFILVFTLMHVYGSEYTYAENPLGYRLKELLGWNRNHYDRIVHFSFGLLLGYPLREYFLVWFKWPGWVCWILPVQIAMSFSCLYEILEWLVADIFFTSQGAAYLGTQGDVWDAEKDMALACSGAVLFVLIGRLMQRILPGKPGASTV